MTTVILRTFTPLSVLQDQRSSSTTPDLVYDEDHSEVALAYVGPQVTWWKHSVSYKLTRAPEEEEEWNQVVATTTASVDRAIHEGLFKELLMNEAPNVRAVAVPGQELDQDMAEATQVQQQEDGDTNTTSDWDSRRVLRIVLLSVTAVGLLAVAVLAVLRRRKKRQEWGILLDSQKDTQDWRSIHSGTHIIMHTNNTDGSLVSPQLTAINTSPSSDVGSIDSDDPIFRKMPGFGSSPSESGSMLSDSGVII